MLAGTIEIEMLANMARLTQDLSKLRSHVSSTMESIEKSVEGAKHALEALGIALSIREMSRFVLDAVESADALGKLAQRTGVAVEALSQLQYVAKQSSVSNDALTMGMKKLNVSMSEGMGGVSAKVEAFANLGISLKDATGRAKTADQVLLEVADRFAATKDGATKTAYAVALFGKAGDEMIPMLNKGSAGIKEMMDQADKLGLTVGKDFAAKAEEFQTNLTILESSSRKLAITLGGALVEGLGEVAKKMAEATIAGGKMHGIMVGLDALGDQMFDWTKHQEEKPLQWLKDDLERLRLQASMIKIDLFGQKGALEAEISQKEKELADMQAKFYRLTSVQGGRGGINPALVVPEKGNLAALSGGASAAEEYARLNKEIEKYNAVTQTELDYGRAIPESMKRESEGISNITDAWARGKITLQQALELQEKLHKATVLKEALELRQKLTKAAQEEAAAMMQQEQDVTDAEAADGKAREAIALAITAQFAALKDTNEQLELERSLLGASDRERAIAIANLQIEQRLRQQIWDIQHSTAYGSQSDRDVDIRNAQEAAAQAKQQASLKAGLQEQLALVGQIESLGKSAWDAFWQSGSDRIKAIGRLLKQFILDQLYQMIAKPFILNIAANIVGGGGGAGGVVGSVAGSALNSAASSGVNSLFGGVGNAFMAGYNGAGTATAISATGDAMGGSAGVLGAVDSQAANVALGLEADTAATGAATAGIETGIGAGVEAGLAAVPVYGWIALAAIALFSAFGSSGGGPKSEAGYGPNGMDISGIDIGGSVQGSQRGDVAAAQQISTGISSSYQAIADQLGLVKDKIDVGIFYAQDPQGTSQTQLQVVGGTYNRSQQEGGIENVDRGDQALKDAIALATAQLILSNLQSSDLKGKIADYIKAIDPTGLTADQINAQLTIAANAKTMFDAFEKLGPAFSSVSDLTVAGMNDLITAMGGMQKAAADLSSYYDNYYSETEKRAAVVADIVKKLNSAGLNVTAQQVANATRVQFRQLVESEVAMGSEGAAAAEALMSVNGEFAQLTTMVSDVNAAIEAGKASFLSDVALAEAALKNASQGAVTDLQNLSKNLTDFAKNMRDTRDQLMLGNLSPYTPGQKYAIAQQQFETLLSQAQGTGPEAEDARSKLSAAATAFLQASQVYNASGAQYQSDFAEVTNALGSIADLADSQASATDQQAALLQTINRSVLTIPDAIKQLASAVMAAIAAGANPSAAAIADVNTGPTGQWNDTGIGQVYTSGGGASLTGGTVYTINGGSYTLGQVQAYLGGLVAAGDGLGAYYALKAAGIALADADKLMSWAPMTAENWASTNGLPVFHDGTDYVPRTGLALLQQGEAVISRSRNFAGGGADSSELLASLIERVDYLTQCQEDGTRALIGAHYDATDRAADKVVSGTSGGNSRAGWQRRLEAEAAPS